MKVVVLCGGRGLRLKGKVEEPKPLVEIGGKPILWHVMRCFSHFGFEEFILCLGYRGEEIEERFAKWGPESLWEEGWRIYFVNTGLETPTGGRVKMVEGLLEGEKEFMVTYADTLSDLDLRGLVEFHRSHGRLATLTAVRPRLPYGALTLSPDGMVRRFEEKPKMRRWVNGGFFVFKGEILGRLEEGSSLEAELLPRLAEEGELVAYKHSGFWASMETYKDVLELNRLWEEGKAGWKVWED